MELRPIPGYQILRPIGRGGMGMAYLAKQLSLGRQVVIKILRPYPDVDPVEQASRFRRESELMASVSHPNVVTIFDFGIDDGRPFLVMEYIEGSDLRGRMVPGQPLTVEHFRALFRPLVHAIEHLHQQGILHRDLKPENILMYHEDTPKVSDFGIAVPQSALGSPNQPQQTLGTIGYMSPEQQYRLRIDERSDQYSLAAICYELLTGELPLGAFRPPSQTNRSIHPSADEVIMRALSEDRTDRYPTIREFGDALDRALAIPRKRSRRLLAAAIVLVLAASGIMAVRLDRDKTPDATTPKVADRGAEGRHADQPPGNGPLVPSATPPSKTDSRTPEVQRPELPPLISSPAPASEGRARRSGKAEVVNSLGMVLVPVPSGEFLMGSPDTDTAARPDEKPQHLVRVIRPFYLGAHEVTVGQFRAFTEATNYKTEAEESGKGGAMFNAKHHQFIFNSDLSWRTPGMWRPQADDEPVVQVSWHDAIAFCDWLSKKEGVAYRLPYEAEWEYACRAGCTGRWSVGDDPAPLGEYAWTRANAGFITHPVGRKRPNAFGLHDILGNVWEWCQDRYAPAYPPGPVENLKGPTEGQERVLRGGSWDSEKVEQVRSTERLHFRPAFRYYTIGFRVRRAFAPPAAPPGPT